MAFPIVKMESKKSEKFPFPLHDVDPQAQHTHYLKPQLRRLRKCLTRTP